MLAPFVDKPALHRYGGREDTLLGRHVRCASGAKGDGEIGRVEDALYRMGLRWTYEQKDQFRQSEMLR